MLVSLPGDQLYQFFRYFSGNSSYIKKKMHTVYMYDMCICEHVIVISMYLKHINSRLYYAASCFFGLER